MLLGAAGGLLAITAGTLARRSLALLAAGALGGAARDGLAEDVEPLPSLTPVTDGVSTDRHRILPPT